MAGGPSPPISLAAEREYKGFVGDDQPTTPVAEAGPVLAGGRLLGGRYRLERRLGAGGMATVWLATDERLGRPVAVKLLSEGSEGDEEFGRRFRREAKLAAGLHHPNLVSVYDFRTDPRPYLVMEYVEGGSLAELIDRGDPPAVERLAAGLLSALSSIHAAGVLHRDVKPHNVLLDSDGQARLADFGIALPSDATKITRTGHVLGTETYLAPEVRQGEPASEQSDLYSLGVLLAEVAECGGASGAIWSLIETLRDPQPARRPRSASAALALLERDLAAPLPVEPTERIAIGGENRRRRTLVAVALAAAAVAVIAGIAMAIDGAGDEPADVLEAGAAKGAADEGSKPDGKGGSDDGGAAAVPSTPENSPADGAALNDQGYALMNEGRYEEAVPVLERAVQLLEGSGDELTYNYALFNLAHALRLAGRPAEAIPLLEQRLEYPDQEAEVAAELAAAKEAASTSGGIESEADGDADEDGTGGTKYKSRDDYQGKGPPPWANGGE